MTRQYEFAPTGAAFARSDKRMRFLFGPIGGGKTTTVLMHILALAHLQSPNVNGVRKTRWAVVRNTRPQLRDSVLRTVFEWLPPNGSTIRWHDTNLDLTLDLPLPDGTRVNCEMMFRPLDDEKDARRLLSVEYTGGWISEFREIPFTLLTDLLSRCGRYPSMADGGADWYGVVGESNMCTKGSDWFNFLMVERPDNVGVWIQPSALSEHAENTKFLKPDYYSMLLNGRGKNWVQAHITSEFPDALDGAAVWGSSFDFDRHVGKAILQPIPNVPVVVGVDQGRSPAAVAMQVEPSGRVRVLRCTYGSGIGMDKFASEYIRPMVAQHFPGYPVLCVIDPAGEHKTEVSDVSPKDVLEQSGFKVVAAPTNALDRRLGSVERQLILANGIVFSPAVAEVISAVASDYKFKTKRNGELEEVPAKTHPTSDLADALQYGVMGSAGAAMGRAMRVMNRGQRVLAPVTPPPAAGWT